MERDRSEGGREDVNCRGEGLLERRSRGRVVYTVWSVYRSGSGTSKPGVIMGGK